MAPCHMREDHNHDPMHRTHDHNTQGEDHDCNTCAASTATMAPHCMCEDHNGNPHATPTTTTHRVKTTTATHVPH